MMPKVARGDTIAASGLLGIALLLGGGSVLFPFYRTIVELVAVIVLAWFCLRGFGFPEGISARVASAIAFFAVLVVVLQLVPVPAELWHGLPGRELVRDARTVLGTAGRPAPVSLTPSATLDTAMFVLTPLAMFVATMRLDWSGRRWLIRIVAIAGLANSLLVILQVQGFAWLTFYTTGELPGVGLFANKNHCAIFIVIAIPAIAWSAMDWLPAPEVTRRITGAVFAGFLAITVFGCFSRAGIVLMPLGLLGATIILLPRLPNRRLTAFLLGGAGLAVLALAFILPRAALVSGSLARFVGDGDLRSQFWPVARDVAGLYWPVGSGFGSFREVFAAAEPISIVQPFYINHAHSDYLELALEGGLPAVLLIVSFVLWFALSAFVRLRERRSEGRRFSPPVIAAIAIVVLLLHSIVDYPLRTLALSCVLATFSAILSTPLLKLDLTSAKSYATSRGSRRGRR